MPSYPSSCPLKVVRSYVTFVQLGTSLYCYSGVAIDKEGTVGTVQVQVQQVQQVQYRRLGNLSCHQLQRATITPISSLGFKGSKEYVNAKIYGVVKDSYVCFFNF